MAHTSSLPGYSAEDICLHTWPALNQRADGRWERKWEIKLRGKIPSDQKLAAISSVIGKQVTDELLKFFQSYNKKRLTEDKSYTPRLILEDEVVVVLERTENHTLAATIITRQDQRLDELHFGATFPVLRLIHKPIGPVATIQGDSLDSWLTVLGDSGNSSKNLKQSMEPS